MFDEKGEINFKFENSNLVIETSGDEELAVFAGVYMVDDGSVSTIERTVERNPLEGSYLLGEDLGTPDVESFDQLESFLQNAPNSLELWISNLTSDTADFSIGGFVDGSMIATMGSLEKDGDKWKYFDEFDEVYTMELEFGDNLVIITALTEDNEKLNGTYIKQAESAEDEFNKYETDIDGLELYEGTTMY